MASPALLEKLASYVPTPIAHAIHLKPDNFLEGATSRCFNAAILFSDISGFTNLTELLSEAAASINEELAHLITTGAEELTALINAYFTEMIKISQTYNGQVVKFSGDALTILFPAEETDLVTAARQASECALVMQAKMKDFATINTSRGSASLSMTVGIGVGQILECSVGGELDRWEYVVGGEPLIQMVMAERRANPGQIVLSPAAWRLAAPFLHGLVLDESQGFVRLLDAIVPLLPVPPQRFDWGRLTFEQRQSAAKLLSLYVPGAIKVRLNEQPDWLAELRRMTIAFVGVGGIDYEAPDAAGRLQKFLQTGQKLLYRFEGSLNKVSVDDKGTVLLLLFGAPPFSHEDDPTRAIAFALELQTVAQQQDLRVVIGITEGTMFAGPVGSPDRQEYTVIGDEVNLAARFMQYGHAGTIIISERVKERANSRFQTEHLGRIAVKGKAQTQPAHLVKGEQGDKEEFVMRYLLREDTFIGRQTELEQTHWVAAKARSGQLQLLFIRGELGIGKSRLASEMLREWLMAGGVSYGGRCISYNRQIPYRVWREVLLAIYGLNPSLSPQRQLARLATGIADLEDPPDQPDYWADRLPLLADVLGLEAPENEFTQTISGQLRRNNTFALIEALLRRQAQRRPVLILLEDVHWADELSLALATYLARKMTDTALLLVLVHRPTGDTNLLADFDNLPYTNVINLEPLSAEESLDFIKLLFEDVELTKEAQDILLSRGQGNPFFLQEIAGAILNGVNDHRHALSDLLSSLNLPETVQDVILNRIDRLAESEKLTLKIASVIGTRFQRSLLSAIHPANHTSVSLSSQLTKLEHEKLIRLEAPAPKWEYDFRNVIVQEVVYEGLLSVQRRQLHKLVGETLEELMPDEVERLAFHYSRSGDWQKALHYLKTAGDKARREYANYAAINYYTEILNYLTTLPRQENLAAGIISTEYWDVLFERTKLYNLIGQRSAELEDLDSLGVLSEALQDDYRRALAAKQWALMYSTSGDYDSGLELIERSVQMAEKGGAEKVVGEGYNLWGKLLHVRGDYKTADAYLQRALHIAQKLQDKSAQADCLNSLGIVARYQADYEVSLYFFQEAIDLWRTLGDQVGLGNSLSNVGQVYYNMGRYQLALNAYHEALSLQQTIGDRSGAALAQLNLGQLHRTLGNYAVAEELFKQALTTYEAVEDRRYEAQSLYHMGFLYCRLEEYNQALDFLDKAVVILRELNDAWALGHALTYYGVTLSAQGDYKQARKYLKEALKLKRETQQTVAVVEDLAYLGQIALARNDMSLADTCVRHVLSYIDEHGIHGLEHPTALYLTCYQILQAAQEFEQAQQLLIRAKMHLSEQAQEIEDIPIRFLFLNNIPENRVLGDLS
ncbi:MAG: tetratricopeptide repeat protein [Anaerolineaceae bacterium]|nr:tetratricopeptide repeat protein [Anaerolineaceae bacterium]